MRDNTTMKYVRTTTTGYIEADMLGQTISISEEMSDKQNTPQRPHRGDMIKNKLSEVLKWSQTAPTALLRKFRLPKCDHNCHKCSFLCSLLRSLKAWQDKKDASVPRYLSGLRRNKRNGN